MQKLMNGIDSESVQTCEVAATSGGGSIQEDFKINVQKGKGYFETGVNNTFWWRLMITAKIFQPEEGIWTIVIKDKANRNLIIYENHHVLYDSEISFNYKTGLKVNFLIEATWNQKKNTTLCGEISIKY